MKIKKKVTSVFVADDGKELRQNQNASYTKRKFWIR